MSDIPGERKRANQSQPVRTANVHASSVWHARLVGLDWSRTSSSSPPPPSSSIRDQFWHSEQKWLQFYDFLPILGNFLFSGRVNEFRQETENSMALRFCHWYPTALVYSILLRNIETFTAKNVLGLLLIRKKRFRDGFHEKSLHALD